MEPANKRLSQRHRAGSGGEGRQVDESIRKETQNVSSRYSFWKSRGLKQQQVKKPSTRTSSVKTPEDQ